MTVTGKYSIRTVNCYEDNQDITLTVTGKYIIRVINAVTITRISH